MPLKKCKTFKMAGRKYGTKGKCYTGKVGKKNAIKQGLAIERSRGKKPIF